MTKQETAAMIVLLRTAYPAFYARMDQKQMEAVIGLWEEMFREEDVNIVKFALRDLIATRDDYPPNIASIKERIREIVSSATGEPTDEELWQLLKNAARNSRYNAEEEFYSLPRVLKRYLGSPQGLRDLADIEERTFDTVNKSNFLKQIKTVRARAEMDAKIPDGIKELIRRTYSPMLEDKSMTPDEVNSARNRLLDRIDGYRA